MGAEGVIVVPVGDVTAQLLRMEEAGIVSVVNPKTPTPFPRLALTTKPGAILPGTTWSTRVVAALSSSFQAREARRSDGGWLVRH